MNSAASHRRHASAALVLVTLLALVAVGCSSSSSGSKSSSGSASTTASAKANPSTPPSCPSASEVDASLKAGLDKPTDQLNGSIRTCTYNVTAGGDDVVIRFQAGVDTAAFDVAAQSPGPSGEISTAVAGLGDAAFTMQRQEPGNTVTELSVLRRTIEISIQAPVPTAQVEMLARKLLSSI